MAQAAAAPLRLAELMAASPRTLGLIMIEADPHASRLDRPAQLAAVSDALADGTATARGLQERLPGRSPDELARKLQVAIETTDDDPMVGSIWRFAEYRPRPPRIMLYNRGIVPLERKLVHSGATRVPGRAS